MTSTAITSTGMRQTQNLTAPPTQNTAPVFEFRCLYTNDLRQKKKRWQDGFLRFHTFNKRIMVYEAPSRNYIGDQHWRENDMVQDGDELQLDRPVLVQVGEAIDRLETDLTELLEKRKKPRQDTVEDTAEPLQRHTTDAASHVSVTTPRVVDGQPSQLRPKSLNALLGTPKGRIGRASVPTKSPHELRQDVENNDWEVQRPAKRQCLDPKPHALSTPAVRPAVRAPAAAISSFDVERRTSPIRTTRHRKERSNVSANVEKSVPSVKQAGPVSRPPGRNAPAKSVDKTISTRQSKTNRSDLASKPVENAAACEVVPVPAEEPSRLPNSLRSRDRDSLSRSSHQLQAVIEPADIVVEEERSSAGEKQKQRTKLQMASRKPRKKLMYRDLLLQDRPPARQPSHGDSDIRQTSPEPTTSDRPSKRLRKTLMDFHEDEQNQLADRLNRHNGKTSSHDDEPASNLGNRETSPSLFVSQDGLDPLPANSSRVTDKCQKPSVTVSSVGHDKDSTKPLPSSHAQQRPGTVISKAAPLIHDTLWTFAKMDEIMFPQSKRSSPPRTPIPIEVEDDDSPVHSSSSPIPETPPKKPLSATSPKSIPTTLVPSSPGIQTQTVVLPSNTARKQPKCPTSSNVTPTGVISAAPSSGTREQEHPSPKSVSRASAIRKPTAIGPTPNPSSPTLPSTKDTKIENPPPLPPKVNARKPPSPDPPPRASARKPHSPEKAIDKAPSPKSPPRNLSSPYPPSPTPISTAPLAPSLTPPAANALYNGRVGIGAISNLPEPLEGSLSIHQNPLPAYQAPRPKPKPKPRSPLRKSTSDTTAMRAPPILSVSHSSRPSSSTRSSALRERERGRASDEAATPWSKEAWDLFGCGRDGVPCTYEEFKRKEGLV